MAEKKPQTTNKRVTDLQEGDVLIGRQGGRSVIERSTDTSGLLGFRRIETEHGQLYMDLSVEVEVLASSPKK